MLCRPRLVAIVLLSSTATTMAQTYTISFTRIANSTTLIPNGSGGFNSFGTPSISATTVAFTGFGSSAQQGIYAGTSTATLAVVANKSTTIDGGTGTFTGFSNPSISGTTVAFVGQGTSSQEGVYTGTAGGTPGRVASTATLIPGGSGNFTNFRPSGTPAPSISGTTAAFVGLGSGQSGVYAGTSGNNPAKVANTSTAIPDGSGNFTGFGSFGTAAPSISGTSVAFLGTGSSSQSGIYIGTTAGGTPATVADTDTAVVGGSGNFTDFRNPSLSGTTVAFVGLGSGQSGVYTGTAGGTPVVVANTSTAIPGGSGNFTSFGIPTLSGTTVAFDASGSGQTGIYFKESGMALTELISNNDALDGKTVMSVSFGSGSLDTNVIAFRADFTDFSSGIYTATFTPIPEPGLILGLAAAGLGGVRLLRRRCSRVRDGAVA